MITKQFTVNVPNEPFSSSTSDGKTVTCTYEGARYCVISTKDGKVQTHEGYFESADDYNASDFVDDEMEYHLIDADAHPMEISFLTDRYTNEDIDNYSETLPTGEVYEYDYPNETGVLDVIYNRWSPNWSYNADTDTFSGLEYETSAITQEQFDAAIANHLELIANIDMSKQDEAMTTAINEYKAFFDNVATTYDGVAPFKIPFPLAPQWNE
jgi:hypothetical protein